MEKFRNLSNYKVMQKKVAVDQGKGAELEHATTLTQARKIVYGIKLKTNTCKCGQATCRRLKGEKSSQC